MIPMCGNHFHLPTHYADPRWMGGHRPDLGDLTEYDPDYRFAQAAAWLCENLPLGVDPPSGIELLQLRAAFHDQHYSTGQPLARKIRRGIDLRQAEQYLAWCERTTLRTTSCLGGLYLFLALLFAYAQSPSWLILPCLIAIGIGALRVVTQCLRQTEDALAWTSYVRGGYVPSLRRRDPPNPDFPAYAGLYVPERPW